jgi:putative oxidoreductase
MTTKDLALLPTRIALGATMLVHGLPKLGEEGARQTGEMLEGMGIRPGVAWAKATGAAEVFGGASALLGVATRLGALAVLVTQGVAVAKVHASKGFNNLAGGWEFNLALMAMAAGLLVAGPGVLSGHELVERRLQRQPLAWLMRPRRTGAALRAVKLLK